MKKTKMYVTDFIKKGKILIILNGFTLNFTDFLCQKFNLRKKKNSLIETINTKSFEKIKIIIIFYFLLKK